MRAASTATVLGMLLGLAVAPAHAVGFGRIANATQLGQPLNFAASVRLDADEVLLRECVAAEVQVGENRLAPSQIRVTLEGGGESTERMVRVTSSTLIDEPVVTVSITLGCSSRVTRRFVAFIDPPLINAAQAAPSELARLGPQRVDSQIAPLTDLVQGANVPARRPAAPRAANRPRPRNDSNVATAPSAEASAAAPGARRPSTPGRVAAAASRTPRGPRLQLDPMPSASADAASGALGGSGSGADAAALAAMAAAAASAASAAEATLQQLTQERQRIQTLETSIAQVRAESQATQKALSGLQARLNQAESERYANPLVYALAVLSALLAIAVAAMWWRQSRRGPAQWWSAQQAAAPAPAGPSAQQVALREQVSAPQVFATGPDVAGAYEPAPSVPTLPPPLPPTAPAPLLAPVAAPEPARELSVEELIDLEQQAEFFIVLGQDEAAIDLLMSHVRSDGGISPLPYLKLLEIYRRRGDAEAYQRIRDRFNRRFNAYAPDWEADLQQGRSLEDYPEVMSRLQSLWSVPEQTMEALDALLFRRRPTDQTFDLPAYRELLFLYSISRDLAEQDASRPGADVDLLLPIGEPEHSGPISHVMATTGPYESRLAELGTQPLDLDVSLPDKGDAPPPKPEFGASGLLRLEDLDGDDKTGTGTGTGTGNRG